MSVWGFVFLVFGSRQQGDAQLHGLPALADVKSASRIYSGLVYYISLINFLSKWLQCNKTKIKNALSAFFLRYLLKPPVCGRIIFSKTIQCFPASVTK